MHPLIKQNTLTVLIKRLYCQQANEHVGIDHCIYKHLLIEELEGPFFEINIKYTFCHYQALWNYFELFQNYEIFLNHLKECHNVNSIVIGMYIHTIKCFLL